MSEPTPANTLAIGADHGGFALKEQLKKHLADRGFTLIDVGTFDGATADYPLIAADVARKISDGAAARGILIDGAGIGSAIVANKFPGVRAALCYDLSSAANSREHNDANVLTLGASLIGGGLATQIVDLWLEKSCTVDRHRRRVAMIEEVERSLAERSSQSRAVLSPVTATGAGRVDGGATECNCRHSSERGAAATCGCHHPPEPQKKDRTTNMDPLKTSPALADLSPDDLERLARRIVELGGAGLAGLAACECCGPGCHGQCAAINPGVVRDILGAGASRIGHAPGGGPIERDVARFIDHTLLKPEATSAQIDQLCREAREHGFASVCINPTYVKQAASLLARSPVRVCTVVGFPLGTHVPEIKALETRRAVRDGATEIDMVINIGALKSGDDELVFRDIRAVVEACMDGGAICKVIIECALLTDDEKVRACLAARRARADFVKTSTGFSTGGATARDVSLMAAAVTGTRMGVKAAGGIRSYEDLKEMVQAGATRIGASAGVAIVKAAQGLTASVDVTNATPSASGTKY